MIRVDSIIFRRDHNIAGKQNSRIETLEMLSRALETLDVFSALKKRSWQRKEQRRFWLAYLIEDRNVKAVVVVTNNQMSISINGNSDRIICYTRAADRAHELAGIFKNLKKSIFG